MRCLDDRHVLKVCLMGFVDKSTVEYAYVRERGHKDKSKNLGLSSWKINGEETMG